MPKNKKRILLGRILGAHGVHGNVLIKSYTQDPSAIADYGAVTDANGNHPLRLEVKWATAKGIIAHIHDIADRDAAEALKGRELYVDRSQLPDTDGDEFYHVDLIGLIAQDEQGNKIGTVIDVANYGASDILEIKLEGTDKTELIPFTPAFAPHVDLENGVITLAMPQEDASKKQS